MAELHPVHRHRAHRIPGHGIKIDVQPIPPGLERDDLLDQKKVRRRVRDRPGGDGKEQNE
jgi:hypothetical protein